MPLKRLFDVKEQSTCDTCLPICLMALLRKNGIKVKNSEEMNILVEGIKFTKLDYSIGQLVYICNKYNVKAEAYIDYPVFHKILSKLDYPRNLKLICEKIDKKAMQRIIEVSPVVIYVDKYYLDRICHYPHFVILVTLNDNYSVIFDPWDGRERQVTTKLLIRSVQSLRNNLKISPKLIRIV